MDASDDGVLHSMLFHSDTELAFACVYNTCSGWGSYEDTNASSALLMKLFWDYFFDMANNSGNMKNWQLGKAHAWSKDAMSPTINWTYPFCPGSWRAVIQGCLLFGDPAQRIKTMMKTPEKPEQPSGPTGGIIEVEYTFSTSTIDPDGDQVYYLWNWSDGTISDWLGPYDSGETALTSHSWTDAEMYNITVKAKDIHNVTSDWSDPLTIHILDVPVLEISDIHGSLFKISVVIKNNGSTDAIGVDWSIILDGGFILLGEESSGTILKVPAREEVTIKSDIILGFGKTMVTVSAEKPGVSSDTKEKEAFVLLFFIKILDE